MPVTTPSDPAELLQHAAWVRRLARQLVAAHDVDDVLQDTLLAAMAQPEPVRSPRAFLAMVVHRCAMRVRRDAGRRRQRELRAARPEALPSTARLLQQVQQEREVAQLAAELEEPFRTVVLLRFFEGLLPAAIAQRLSVPASTVRTRLHRGLQQLRQRLQQRHGPDWRAGLSLLCLPRSPVPAAPLLAGALAMSSTSKTISALAVLALLAATIWFASSTSDLQEANAAPAAVAAAKPRPIAEQAARQAAAQRVEAPPLPMEVAAPDVATLVAVRGRVLDSRGQAMPSVPVHLCEFGQGSERIGDVLTRIEALSDAFGVFQLAVGKGQTAVPMAGAGYCTLRTTPSQPLAAGEQILLIAAPAADLTGIVRGPDGMPLQGAGVAASTFLLEEFPLPLEHTYDPQVPGVTTAADGRFTLPRTPLAAGVDLLFYKPGFESKRVPSLQAASGFLEVTLGSSAGAPGRITGTVLDASGHAVAGAELRLGDGQQTQSLANGGFGFDYPQRPSRLLATRAGFQPVVREGVGKDTPMPLLLEFTAPARGIAGRVVDANGAPMPGMLVNLLDPTPADGETSLERLSAPPLELPHRALGRCDAEGRFAIAGLADRNYRLRAFDPDTLVSVQSEPIAAGSTDVVLTVPADLLLADFAGIVVGRDGRGIGGVAVGTSLLTSRYDGVDSVMGPLATTDAAGRFLLHKLPRQHVRLLPSGDDLVDTLVPIEQVLADPEHRLEVLRRCFVQIEGPLDVEVGFVDAAGKELWLGSQTQGMSFATNGWRMRTAKSPVLTLAETAAVMVWSRAGKELGRKAIAVEPGKDRVTQLVAGK